MVDNDNQWDEIDYSEGNTQEYYGSDEDYNGQGQEYSEEDYDNSYDDNELDDYDNQDSSASQKKSNMLPIIIAALLLIGLAGFFILSKMSGNGESGTANNSAENNLFATEQSKDDDSVFSSSNDDDEFFNQDEQNSSDLMSVNFSDSGDAQVNDTDNNEDIVATIKDDNENNDLFSQSNNDFGNETKNENNDIIISYDKAARTNPFKPPFEAGSKLSGRYVSMPDTEFEIIEPPTTSVPDANLTKLLKTQISGILYDDVSPSAIVNLNGVDTFVKTGDTIYGYTIKSITKNQVEINYKNNTYVAAVGELFTKGTIPKAAVANLENKFAGRYKN